MKSLKSRVAKLENTAKVNDHIIFEILEGEDPKEKQKSAWEAYVAQGGRAAYEDILFVRINKFF